MRSAQAIAASEQPGKEIGQHVLAASDYDGGHSLGFVRTKSGEETRGYVFVSSVELGRCLENTDTRPGSPGGPGASGCLVSAKADDTPGNGFHGPCRTIHRCHLRRLLEPLLYLNSLKENAKSQQNLVTTCLFRRYPQSFSS